MDKQISLSRLNDKLAQVQTEKKEFIVQIEQIVPWGEWETIIKPCNTKENAGIGPTDPYKTL